MNILRETALAVAVVETQRAGESQFGCQGVAEKLRFYGPETTANEDTRHKLLCVLPALSLEIGGGSVKGC